MRIRKPFSDRVRSDVEEDEIDDWEESLLGHKGDEGNDKD